MHSEEDTPRAPLDIPARKHALQCPVEDWLTFLGHRWNAMILWHLQATPLRHGELSRRLDRITPKVLTERLISLEHRGLIRREARGTFPPGVVYSLSEQGQLLMPILNQLEVWSKR